MKTIIDETAVEFCEPNGMHVRIPLTFRIQADLDPGDRVQFVEDSDRPGELIIRKSPTTRS